MKSRCLARSLLLAVCLAVAAPALAWKLVVPGEPFVNKRGFSVQFPEGWRWVKGMMAPGEVAATRDGPELQLIFIDWSKHKGAFAGIREDAAPDMPPQEVAEKYAASLRETRGLANMEILANEPVMLSGLPGFRLHLAYRSSVDVGSVRYQEIIVGTNTADGLYTVFYRAPLLHYFERDLPAFEAVLGSFRLTGGPAR